MIFFLLLFTIFVIIIISWLNILLDRKKVNIPGNFPLPLMGNGHELLGDSTMFLAVLGNYAKKYNDCALFYLGTDRYLTISHPKYIETLVSSSELITKGRSYFFLHEWLGDGLLTSTGQRWRVHRKFLTPAFHFNVLQHFLPVFFKNDAILKEKLLEVADGKPVNVFPLIALNALDNVVESVMGVPVNVQQNHDSEYLKAVETLARIISLRVRNPLMAIEPLFQIMPMGKQQREALKVLHGQTRKVIEARKEELIKNDNTNLKDESEIGIRNKHAFLDLLLLAEIDGKRIEDEKIREEVDTFMFEGHDTTTSGITFCLYNISTHEDVQNKLFEEQKQIFGGDMNRDPTANELRQMKYLDSVIKESMRLHPPVPLIERTIGQDIELGGVKVPRNTNIIINIFETQRNPLIFDDPLKFIPEREEKSDAKSAFNYIPFSAGPRNCIGQKYALLEMKVAISSIIRHFKLMPSGIEPELGADLVLRSANGVYVKIYPRQ